jgi:hypothetical protein
MDSKALSALLAQGKWYRTVRTVHRSADILPTDCLHEPRLRTGRKGAKDCNFGANACASGLASQPALGASDQGSCSHQGSLEQFLARILQLEKLEAQTARGPRRALYERACARPSKVNVSTDAACGVPP